jgi:uncharacterized protein (DUF885 family)
VSALRTLINDYVDAYFRFRPGEATEKGYAAYAGHAPSFQPDEVARFRGAVEKASSALADLRSEDLSTDDAVDLAALKAQLDVALFDIDRLKTFEHNPVSYVLPALDGIEALEIQGRRDEALARCLAGVPALLAQAIRQIETPMEPFREVAVEMVASAIEHFGEAYGSIPDHGIAEASDQARRSMHAFVEHFEKKKSEARPFSPMGEENYLYLLSHDHLLTGGLDPILELAHRTMAEVRELLGGDDDDDEDSKIDVPPGFGWKDVLAYYRSELKHVRSFVVKKDLITIPRGKLSMIETPEYLRALIPGVSYQPPPAFSRKRQGYLFIRPVPRDMTEEDRRNYYDRVSSHWFRNTIAHECWPGHHVQLLRAASHPSAIRKFRDNDVMVEGWGLYSESVVREQGMWEGTESVPTHRALNFRAARVVVDVGIHTGRLTLEGAVEWMVKQFGEWSRKWVSTEVRRYATEPTQAMSYLVGQKMIQDLRAEWTAAVGPKRFSLRRFHDELIGEGSLPIPLIRRKMLEQAVEHKTSVAV